MRSWPHRIATNVCIDMSRQVQRRAAPRSWARPRHRNPVCSAPDGPRRPGSRRWPTPGSGWSGATPPRRWPSGTRCARRSSPPCSTCRPAGGRSLSILCEVLSWSAAETVALLGTSVPAVNSALQRARATLAALPGGGLPGRSTRSRPTWRPATSTPSSTTASSRWSRCSATTTCSTCRRSSCGCREPTTSAGGCSSRGRQLPGLPAGGHRGQRLPGVRPVPAGPRRRVGPLGDTGPRGVGRSNRRAGVLPRPARSATAVPGIRAAAAPRPQLVALAGGCRRPPVRLPGLGVAHRLVGATVSGGRGALGIGSVRVAGLPVSVPGAATTERVGAQLLGTETVAAGLAGAVGAGVEPREHRVEVVQGGLGSGHQHQVDGGVGIARLAHLIRTLHVPASAPPAPARIASAR